MNGVHDMGGLQAFGPVLPEPNEPVFHAAWERRAFALTLAAGALGQWNLDKARSARESLPPTRYLTHPYYLIWLEAAENMLVTANLVTPTEILTGRAETQAVTGLKVLSKETASVLMTQGGSTLRSGSAAPKFVVGQRVHTKQLNPQTHTRLPRYCRDKVGTVFKLHGIHVFPDTNAQGLGEQPEFLYTIQFDAHVLWGADTTATTVFVDCWEPYLDEATA